VSCRDLRMGEAVLGVGMGKRIRKSDGDNENEIPPCELLWSLIWNSDIINVYSGQFHCCYSRFERLRKVPSMM
jgi:hypothetical protein